MTDFKYKYNNEHIKYMKAQIWEIDGKANGDMDYYSRLSIDEFKIISKYIPKKVKNAMDLGCGMGRCGVYLYNKLFSDHKTKFVFCDSELISSENSGSRLCNSDEIATYNSVLKTNEFVALNGVKNYKVVDFNTSNFLENIPCMDLIVSMYSVGFHFSFTDWIAKLSTILTKDTVLILGIHDPVSLKLCDALHDGHNYRVTSTSQSIQQIKECFTEVNIVKGLLSKHHPNCHYMILKGYVG
jgi:hypothetical protein